MNLTIDLNINTILSNDGGVCIELIHHSSDPSVWVVRSSKKFLWFRLNKTSVWFQSKDQALAFAKKRGADVFALSLKRMK